MTYKKGCDDEYNFGYSWVMTIMVYSYWLLITHKTPTAILSTIAQQLFYS